MKKYKKTYAILHLAEKHTVFHLGKTKVHVSFTGGIITKKGIVPATFTTDDPIVQLAIENSEDFKNGAVTLQSQYLLDGDVKIGRNPTKETITELNPEDKTEELNEESPSDNEVVTEEPIISDYDESKPIQQPEESKEDELQLIEVSCRDVAKQYLQEHYGEKPTPLRTIADIQECAAKYGIMFKFD